LPQRKCIGGYSFDFMADACNKCKTTGWDYVSKWGFYECMPEACATGYYFNGFSPYSCVANIDPTTCTTPGKTVRDNACQDCTNGAQVLTWSTTETCQAETCAPGYEVDGNSHGCSNCQNWRPWVATWSSTEICTIASCSDGYNLDANFCMEPEV
jgi:hypothetical protein